MGELAVSVEADPSAALRMTKQTLRDDKTKMNTTADFRHSPG
jgi:hypothetical protein